MQIAISPCPNDTSLFYPWIFGLIGANLPITPHFADIEQLNCWAKASLFPLIKLSLSCFEKVTDAYQLLPAGSALGHDCGPKLIAKTAFPLEELPQKSMAIPGNETTAHLLQQRLLPEPEKKLFCLYHEVLPLIQKGVVDCGLIIHETRFTYPNWALTEIADLGTLWHAQFGIPLPLGGLAVARTLPTERKQNIVKILKEAFQMVKNNPDLALPFILQHSQEKDPTVVKQHIDTFVTDETRELSSVGRRAIETLLPGLPKDWLFK